MKLQLLSLACMLSTGSWAQSTLIPDPVFELLLIEAGLDEFPQDGEVLTASIDTVTTLNLFTSGSTNVTDLSGIGDFVALEYLMVNFAELTSLDLSQNLSLQELHAYANDIHTLLLPPTESLIYLEMTGNPIGSLDVSQNPMLEFLSCSYCELSELDVSGNPELRSISVMVNTLSILDVNENLLLESLSCGVNELMDLDVSGNTLMKTLGCSTNNIGALELSQMDSLNYLGCNSNQLTSLDIQANQGLTYLDCSDNQIASLDASNHPEMIELFCQYNELESLEVSPGIIGLNCSGNQLNALDVSGVLNLAYFFDCSVNPLTCVQVSEAQISDIPDFWVADDEDVFSLDCNSSGMMPSGSEEWMVRLFPNPTHDSFQLVWEGESSRNLIIYDALGSAIRSDEVIWSGASIAAPSSPGSYLLELRGASEKSSMMHLLVH